MKVRHVASCISVVLATLLGTVCASVGASTSPHIEWKVGRPIGTATTGSSFDSGLAYGSGNVFIAYCTDDGVGFAAHDAMTGAMKWNNTNLLEEFLACKYPPLYHSGSVFAVGSYSAVAFNASTGAVLWSQRNTLNNFNGVIAFDSLNGNIVFMANGNGFVVSALDARTGAIRWQHSLNTWAQAGNPESIAVGDNHVYVPNANGTVAALHASTGALDWAVDVPRSSGETGPVATACGVLVVSDYYNSQVYGVDPATGATQWMLSVDTNLQPPVVDETSCTAYFATLDGAAAIAVLSGTVTWKATNGKPSFSMPAVAGGRFWEVSYKNSWAVPAVPTAVVTRNATTGTVTGTLPLNVGTATGSASRVTVTSTDGSMFFFVLSDITLYGVSAV